MGIHVAKDGLMGLSGIGETVVTAVIIAGVVWVGCEELVGCWVKDAGT